MAKRDLSADKFQQQLSQIAEGFRRTIEAQVDGFNPDPLAQQIRVALCETNLEAFARNYFPHYIQYAASELHAYLFDRLPKLVAHPKGRHLALAAPRGEAKSTIVSLIFAIWCQVYNKKHYICLVMDSFDQVATMLEAIKAELETNPRLKMDFPKATGAGRLWQQGVIVTANDVKIQAFGSGKRMRGLRHGPYRVDLVIGDDLENDENVRKPEQRDKLESWLKKTVLQLGAADGTMDVVVIGTVLHYDSLLARLLQNPLWERMKFQAIIQWPDNMYLWEQFEGVLLAEGEEVALAFYAKHKRDMDTGAKVSWAAARPLVALVIIRARDGHSAFDSEYQNDPVSGEGAPFAHCIQFWVNRLYEWVFYGACDPSLGKHGNGRDPSAILVGGFNRETGILDCVEAQIKKRVPDRIIEDIIALQAEYGCLLWGIEAVQFQEFLRTELVKRSAARGIPVPARPLMPNSDKVLRIESLQPHVANGLIRLHPSQTTLLSQLKHFPKADHDDGPDALHMLWLLATSGLGGLPAINTRRHRNTLSWENY
jgi:predicted phage terminase large subunit-like protein